MKRSALQHFFFLLMINWWPCIWGSGARVVFLSRDYHELHVELPLNWRTRNRVGTIFGGSMYASVDPFYMILLMEVLGPDYVIWDKAAEIQFRRPGKTTLKAIFKLTPEMVATIKGQADREGEFTFDLQVDLKDRDGVVHANVRKSLYVATKEFYRRKVGSRPVIGKA